MNLNTERIYHKLPVDLQSIISVGLDNQIYTHLHKPQYDLVLIELRKTFKITINFIHPINTLIYVTRQYRLDNGTFVSV